MEHPYAQDIDECVSCGAPAECEYKGQSVCAECHEDWSMSDLDHAEYVRSIED